MQTALIVTAHPEPRSFTSAWAAASVSAMRAEGYEVLTSDLYAMSFDAAEGPRHFSAPPRPFDALKAQERGPLPADVAAEVAKLRAADLLILHFPLWWFAPPAILKGWCDRALAHGPLHDVDNRFDTGRMRGKSVLFCVSTGANASESGPDGCEGDTRLLLWPLAQTFRYCGYTILAPEIVHGVHSYHRDDRRTTLEARLAQVLDMQGALIGSLGSRPVWPFNADSDFGPDGRLRSDAPSHSPFIRHPAAS